MDTLHYLYPDEIDDKLIEAVAGRNDKIMKYSTFSHPHINDAILKRCAVGYRGGDSRPL
jgi:tRNA A37 methylthiotransferase MiaB